VREDDVGLYFVSSSDKIPESAPDAAWCAFEVNRIIPDTSALTPGVFFLGPSRLLRLTGDVGSQGNGIVIILDMFF
jgi:hypothetical protein